MPPRKSNKKPKDLNAPKRPSSSYILFNKSRQKSLKEIHPDKKLTDLTKIVGVEWKALTPVEKAPFEQEASELKEAYKVKIEEYKKSDLFSAYQAKLEKWKARQGDGESGSDDSDDAPAPPPKRPKDPHAPKKPLSAFFIFQTRRRQELKEEHPDKKNTDLSKMTGAEWKAMSADLKEPFEEKAKEKKADYAIALAAYKETEEFQQFQATIEAWKESKKKKAKKPKKKKAPSPSPSDNSESSGDDSDESSDDGDAEMNDRQASSSDDEEYSSDSD